MIRKDLENRTGTESEISSKKRKNFDSPSDSIPDNIAPN